MPWGKYAIILLFFFYNFLCIILLISFPTFFQCSQCHGCWWLGDTRSNVIDLVFEDYHSISNRWFLLLSMCECVFCRNSQYLNCFHNSLFRVITKINVDYFQVIIRPLISFVWAIVFYNSLNTCVPLGDNKCKNSYLHICNKTQYQSWVKRDRISKPCIQVIVMSPQIIMSVLGPSDAYMRR